MPEEKIESLKRSFFEISGAHPYVFDALAFVCTYHKKAIERGDNPLETHYRVRIPIDNFMDFALDGRVQFKHRLMAELYDMAMIQKGKVLPLDAKHSVLTVPVRVELLYKDGSRVNPAVARQLENLNGQLPVDMIAIEFYKPLFHSLLKGEDGESWFPLPKAFNAKMLELMDILRDKPEFKYAGITALPNQYRKVYLYMNLHDNSIGEYLHLDAIDSLLSCYPSLISTRRGVHYIDDWWPARLFMKKAALFFYQMADRGLMEGVKLVPTGIWYDKPLRKFRFRLQRNQSYKAIEAFKDESPYADLPDLRPNTSK